MKYTILFLMFFVYSTHAQHNNIVNKSSTLETKVITPFAIWDYTENSTPFVQEVILGQKRTISPAEGSILFQMKKETNYSVSLVLNVPNPVDYVTIKAHWYFNDTPPVWSGDFPGIALNSSWIWYDTQTDGWITVRVEEIDATDSRVTTGIKTFEAKATGFYTGL